MIRGPNYPIIPAAVPSPFSPRAERRFVPEKLMISALTGQLVAVVDDARVSLAAGPFTFELLVPAADVEALRGRVGAEVTFHTLFYLEGSAGGGNLDPRLIGFSRPEDKAFFNLFTTVKGI